MTASNNETDSNEMWVPIREYAERTGKNVHTITTQVYRKKRESRKGIWNGEEAVLVKMNPSEALDISTGKEDNAELIERIENLKNENESLKIQTAVLETRASLSLEPGKAITLLLEVIVEQRRLLQAWQEVVNPNNTQN